MSQASLWEITIKAALGKLVLLEPWPETLRRVNTLTPDLILPITPQPLEALYPLPWHHRDPFDRMLVAQVIAEDMTLVAQVTAEDMTLVSSDVAMDAYGIRRLW